MECTEVTVDTIRSHLYRVFIIYGHEITYLYYKLALSFHFIPPHLVFVIWSINRDRRNYSLSFSPLIFSTVVH